MDSENGPAVRMIFRTLGYRNFRLFFFGQSISLVGTWMQAIAMGWLVYRLTNSAFLLGLVGFASQIPAFLLGPLAGVVADRFNKHKILIVTQTLSMIQAFILAWLTMSGIINVWHLIALGIFLGCVNAFDMPARQAFLVEMVEKKENLGNAIALNSSMFNAARLIGPSIAGVLIAVAGEGTCFLINGVSFTAVIISLLAMSVKERGHIIDTSNIFERLKEGFSYAFGFAPIKLILLLLGVISLMGSSYMVLMPVFARDVLGGDSSTLGFLMAAGGIGALVSTVYLALRKSIVGLARMIPVSSVIFAASIIAFSFSKNMVLSIIFLAVAGFGLMTHMAASNIILQTIVDDDKRGRVMSFYVMAFMGSAPFGSLFAGFMATKVGASNTLIIGGSCCIIAAALFASKLPLLASMIHPIYRKIGIIPEVASGLGVATRLTVPPED
jgi:MFS family permease